MYESETMEAVQAALDYQKDPQNVFVHRWQDEIISNQFKENDINLDNCLVIYAGNKNGIASVCKDPKTYGSVGDLWAHQIDVVLKENPELEAVVYNRLDESILPENCEMVEYTGKQIKEKYPNLKQYFVVGVWDGSPYQKYCPSVEIVGSNFFLVDVAIEHHARPTWSYDFDYKKDFLCLNRMPRLSRLYLCALLQESGLRRKGHISLDLTYARSNDVLNMGALKGLGQADPDESQWEKVENVLRKPGLLDKNWCVDRDDVFATNPINMRSEEHWMFDETRFSVIVETTGPLETDYVLPYITEKCKKSLYHKHPFIIAGVKNTLNCLHASGFKTFHPYIDETYDQIECPLERMNAIVSEIKRLCDMSESEKLEFHKNIEPIVEYNFDKFMSASFKHINRNSRLEGNNE